MLKDKVIQLEIQKQQNGQVLMWTFLDGMNVP